MIDEAQKALEEAEALKKVSISELNTVISVDGFILLTYTVLFLDGLHYDLSVEICFSISAQLPARQEPVLDSSKYTAADVRIMSPTDSKLQVCDICGPFLSVYDSD
ncbi:hypothetical protein SLE2022_323420 [Rubroshorea leprosula]